MKSRTVLLYLTFTTVFVLTNSAYCDPLSTVFVLETSESDTSPNNGESSSNSNKAPLEDPNTQIITDDSSAQLRSTPTTRPPPSNHQHLQQQQHQPSYNSKPVQHHYQTDSPVIIQHHNQQHHNQQHHPANSSHNTDNGNPSTTSRRLEEESHIVGGTSQYKAGGGQATRSNTNHQSNQNHQPAIATVHRSKQSSSTSTSSYDTDQSYTTPKTEERLLISITSDDIDYKPPQKVSSSGSILGNGGGNEGYLSANGQQGPHHHQKRKPSITISIEDPNGNKQNENSGQSPTVIVRPSENGQGIVISTVGGTGLVPTINSNHNNKQPIEIPVHHQQHHTSTSTYRPLLTNDYNTVNQNRPITSSLINDEHPQRPVVVSSGGSDENYESRPVTRPPSSPVRPTSNQDSFTNGQYDDLNTELSKPINSNSQQQQSSESKYPLNERNCGLVHETRIVGGEEANPDDFLWMAAIIKSKPKDGDARPFCGGSLITRRHILTAAHCLENLAPRDVLVRLGSYDFDDSTASSLSADFAIDQFRVPAQYSKKTHAADIAIMRLKTPLSLQDNYKTVCMPIPRRSYVGALGTVTGYGSQSQTFRRAAPKLRQVTVPIWENRKCSVVYKKNLTESFLCAGYEEGGKDACQGDSGGPLMTDGPNERMMIVGVVSHGIGCGSPGYPGVYTRTTTYLDWIEKNTKE